MRLPTTYHPLYMPPPTLFGLPPRHAIRVATPIVTGLLSLAGIVFMIRQKDPRLMLVGAAWSLVGSLGTAAAALGEAFEAGGQDATTR